MNCHTPALGGIQYQCDHCDTQVLYHSRRDNQPKIMKLECGEFIRRFLMHVLLKGLMRIRHYGLLANRCRRKSLEIICKILAQLPEAVVKQQRDEPPAPLPEM